LQIGEAEFQPRAKTKLIPANFDFPHVLEVIYAVFNTCTLAKHHNREKNTDTAAEDDVEVVVHRPEELRPKCVEQRGDLPSIMDLPTKAQYANASGGWLQVKGHLVYNTTKRAFC